MSNTCPQCARPVALARASCLYCGATLGEEQVAAAAAAVQALAAETAAAFSERHIVVLDVSASSGEALGAALGLPPFDAAQRIRRGGYQLHRIADPALARQEADRLVAAGLRAMVIPEAEARQAADPQLALGGDWVDDGLALRTADGERHLRPADLLLMVRGPIARALEEPQRYFKRVRVAGPGEGQRVHLHLHARPRPIELDPDDFELSPPAGGTVATVMGWLRDLCRQAPVDEGFRYLAPALGPAQRPVAGDVGAAQALSPALTGTGGRPALFDNVAQFRFYSGWRAAVARRAASGGSRREPPNPR